MTTLKKGRSEKSHKNETLTILPPALKISTRTPRKNPQRQWLISCSSKQFLSFLGYQDQGREKRKKKKKKRAWTFFFNFFIFFSAPLGIFVFSFFPFLFEKKKGLISPSFFLFHHLPCCSSIPFYSKASWGLLFVLDLPLGLFFEYVFFSSFFLACSLPFFFKWEQVEPFRMFPLNEYPLRPL